MLLNTQSTMWSEKWIFDVYGTWLFSINWFYGGVSPNRRNCGSLSSAPRSAEVFSTSGSTGESGLWRPRCEHLVWMSDIAVGKEKTPLQAKDYCYDLLYFHFKLCHCVSLNSQTGGHSLLGPCWAAAGCRGRLVPMRESRGLGCPEASPPRWDNQSPWWTQTATLSSND